jgi:hypothetical protein
MKILRDNTLSKVVVLGFWCSVLRGFSLCSWLCVVFRIGKYLVIASFFSFISLFLLRNIMANRCLMRLRSYFSYGKIICMRIHFLSILMLSFSHRLQSLLNRLVHTNFVVISNFQVVSIHVLYLHSLILIFSFFVIR